MAFPSVTPLALPSLAAGVLSPAAPAEMAVPSVNKTNPPENPPETSTPAQVIVCPEEASVQASADQSNGVPATEETTKNTEEIESETTAVSPQGVTAEPAGASADLPVPQESVSSAEAPVSSSEPHIQEEVAAPEKVQINEESAVVAEESANQEVTQIPAKEETSGEEPAAVAEEILDDPKPSASEEISVKTEDEKKSEAPKMAEECQKDVCLDVAPEVSPGDVSIDVSTQNENLDKEEPVILLSKAIQSKGTSKCEDPPLSTHHLSGWFIFCKKTTSLLTITLFHCLKGTSGITIHLYPSHILQDEKVGEMISAIL